jgi:hypothetical protein
LGSNREGYGRTDAFRRHTGDEHYIQSTRSLLGRAASDLLPFFPRIRSAKAFATSRPPVSLSHSGCVKVDMLAYGIVYGVTSRVA